MIWAHAKRDRTGDLLVWLTNPAKRGSMIIELVAGDGRRLRMHEDINKEFHDFYAELYSRVVVPSMGPLAEIPCPLWLPTLTQADAEALGELFTPQKVRTKIKAMFQNKTPGMDGLPIQFYAAYMEIMTPK
ncbi:hypothetical protein NDU88_003340 [Pleurodeles waltl]|uniref:Reverse transcriptase n=1 Tax=Pleurodeles waltl TaxID=8319 RepID=A0AAV7W1V0_PLEWA|nr:hypothetical protein NDU88_003340 [Pleurodeles waltl]